MANPNYHSAYYQAHIVEEKAKRKDWYAKPSNRKTAISRSSKRQSELSTEDRRVIASRHYEKNRDKILAKAKEAYATDPEPKKAKTKAHAKKIHNRQRKDGAVPGRRVGKGVRTTD